MEEVNTNIKRLFVELKEYLNLRVRLSELQAKNAVANLIAVVATSVAGILFLSMTLVFASFALAYYLSDVFGSYASGFLIVAGIYLLLTLFVLLLKSLIKTKISDGIIALLFKDSDDEQNSK